MRGMIDSPYLVKAGKKLKLSKLPTDDTGPFNDKDDAQAAIDKNLDRLKELQEVLYAEGKHAVLVVFQAMDCGGKDGAIEHVFSGVNPQGCSVTSFKVPTSLERAHDFLWRHHIAAPAKGMIGIHNRSHYESVLVERVHDIAPRSVWKDRYDRINAFERLLADEGTTILKFFLHISRAEQKRRLESRLADKDKNWKFNVADLKERERWDDYMDAYQDALENCSTKHAPWYVVPADKKWFRNWVISDTIVRTMKKLDMRFPPAPEGLDKITIK
jgi:PPK2 family polyphosphate:nucleotide phosphotransferase